MRTDDLIERFIEIDVHHPGAAGALLRASGVPVWVLVAQLPAADGSVEKLASEYDISIDAVHAALAYYRRHRKIIDARIALNAA